MRTTRITGDNQTQFVILDADPSLHAAIEGLIYQETDHGFAKTFANDAAHLDRAWTNFQQHAEAMVLQAAGQQSVPWEHALETFLGLIADHDFDWFLGGSGALAVRGLAVQPHDLDLIVEGGGAPILADLLCAYLVEPLIDSTGWIGHWFTRAWLGARVEWVGDIDPAIDDHYTTDFGPKTYARLDTVQWHGYAIRVPPLDLQLAVCEQRGLAARAALIRAVL